MLTLMNWRVVTEPIGMNTRGLDPAEPVEKLKLTVREHYPLPEDTLNAWRGYAYPVRRIHNSPCIALTVPCDDARKGLGGFKGNSQQLAEAFADLLAAVKK